MKRNFLNNKIELLFVHTYISVYNTFTASSQKVHYIDLMDKLAIYIVDYSDDLENIPEYQTFYSALSNYYIKGFVKAIYDRNW